MKNVRKKTIMIIALFVSLPFIMIGTDYSLALADKSPIFSVRTAIYKDGGTQLFVGLGYKVINYNELDGRTDVEFIPFFAGGEEEEEVTTNSNETKTDDLDLLISDYIVYYNKYKYFPTEKQFEVHHIYGTEEIDGLVEVYLYSLYTGFNRATKDEGQSGRSGPALVKLKKTNDGYSVVEYKEPGDGDMYVESIYEMFPDNYAEQAINDTDNVRKKLDEQIKAKVADWLAEGN
ncbi:MAG: hypothetical protein ACK4M9_21920 [Anaerobacillus sp.]|uniref:hypothetical protein n=1 Tax=Anaerobacillus sp. TaxID=1872506 RepID=UPI00391C81A8